MILVYGTDEPFVGDVITHLQHCGHAALHVPPDAHLFSEVVEHRAHAVIGLAARKPAGDEQQHGRLVEELIAASNAPSSPRIVLVTPGPLDGPHVRALKRSGAPYVVVSSLGVQSLARSAKREPRTVFLSRRLLEREHSVVTESALLCAIATAVADDGSTGIELTPHGVSWREALQAVGVRVLAVPNWLAKLAYLCGAPALYLATARVCIRLGDEDAVPVVGALPAATATP